MKLLQKMKQKKADNKGFSLVELIIVIAIMAILVGIVGTQVVPYLTKSKEARDRELLNSFSTAAMTAYSSKAGEIPASGTIVVKVYDTTMTGSAKTLANEIQNLTYKSTEIATLKAKFTSDKCKSKVGDIQVTYDFDNKKITVVPLDSTGATISIDPVVSDM